MKYLFRFTLWMLALLLPALVGVNCASRDLITAPTAARNVVAPRVVNVQHPAVIH